MRRLILVAYGTKSGSTGEVAEAVGDALREHGATVDVRQVGDLSEVGSYDALIVGSPVLYGKPHPAVAKFLEINHEALSRMPVAVFLTCLELTKTVDENERAIPTYVDPSLGRPPADEDKLSYFEKTHLMSGFLNGLLESAPQVKPVSVAVFRGKLDYGELDWISRLVMRLIWLIYRRAPEGDSRNWQAIRSWATTVSATLLAVEGENEA
jgi:menaquinone-dependent protoporphyrinogen oxidase